MSNELFKPLFSVERSPEISEEGDIYGWLIGRWSAEVRDYHKDGQIVLGRGEWTFGRVLEGRAVQDVWISPPPAERPVREDPARPIRNRYGTSFRYFEAVTNSWKVIWVNPVTGIRTDLTGRKVGDRIVQTGYCNGRVIRWNFSDIGPDSFRWTGESLADDGESWDLEAEFLAQRMSG